MNQGVEHFYLYYNGKINNKILNILKNKKNVTLIEWNFRYWNYHSTFIHHAQLGQIHHAIYRYGKDLSEYMIFCDFDEYLYNSSFRLNKLIQSKLESYCFYNVFCELKNNYINSNFVEIYNSDKIKLIEIGSRNKSIHKMDFVEYIGIHFNDMDIDFEINKDFNNTLFHFYNLGDKSKRKFDCKNIKIVEKNHELYYVICELILTQKFKINYIN